MANRLGKLPISTADTRFGIECRYCQSHPSKNLHETELLAKARKLCKHYSTNHFLAYVTSELDKLDHAKLTRNSEIEILVEIHNKLGCDCLTSLTATIQDLTHSAALIEPATPTSTTTQTDTSKSRTTPPKKPAKTLLERLQNGKNGTHKTG